MLIHDIEWLSQTKERVLDRNVQQKKYKAEKDKRNENRK